jgi:glycosyl-4,4'-diaponeurosporenoate acyltransferase
MRVLFLSNIDTAILDIVAWLIFHLSIGYFSSRIPIGHFNPDDSWYQTKSWERDGEIYQRIFYVKNWKKLIPSGGALYPNTYEIKHLTDLSIENVRIWIKESCRSEFCHFVMIVPGFLFYLWNNVETGTWMVVYAILNNLEPIVMQRYNRPRVRKVLARLERKSNQKGEIAISYEPQTVLLNSYK